LQNEKGMNQLFLKILSEWSHLLKADTVQLSNSAVCYKSSSKNGLTSQIKSGQFVRKKGFARDYNLFMGRAPGEIGGDYDSRAPLLLSDDFLMIFIWRRPPLFFRRTLIGRFEQLEPLK
jgi:hypothetical protein